MLSSKPLCAEEYRTDARDGTDQPRRNEALVRWTGCACLATAAAIHLVYLASEFTQFPLLGFGAIAIIVASALAIILLTGRDRRGWILGMVACGVSICGYVLLRLANPMSHGGDPSEWLETSGIAALIIELLLIVLAISALWTARPEIRPN